MKTALKVCIYPDAYAGAALPEGRAEMTLNRPFIYYITAPDGSLLFVGVCENPAER